MSDTGEDILFFILVSLVIGGFVREIQKFSNIPYTPMLLVIGIVWGSLSSYIGLMGESASIVSDINPHLILLIFLPALVYESSASTDWHTFRRELGQVMMLAFPGVVISAVLSAVTIMYILGYSDSFSWADALVLGSILAATDPVAVVSLLKEVGASKNLATLIEGESLLNDGTAMVMFTVVLEISKGNEVGVEDVVYSFVRMTFGGPLLGLIFGIAMAFWIKRIFNDSVLEVLITFFTVYLVFYIAEGTALHVSGILALVALGLYMSAWGKTSIDVYSESVVHGFWKMMGFIVETLIFLLSGIIIGEKVISADHIGLYDWLKLPLLFLMLTIIRSLVVLISYPVLKKYAYGFSWQEAVILVHGGLRGAVGLTLALIVNREVDDIDSEVRDRTLFYTAGIATITLMINATTTGYLISKLGLAKVSKTRKNLLQQVSTSLYDDSVDAIKELRQHKYLSFADWKKVKKLASVSSYNQLNSALNSISPSNIQDPLEIECEIRHRFLCMLKGMYWDEYEKGQCSASTALALIESVDECLDFEETPMKDWQILEKNQLGSSAKLFMKCKKLPVIGKLFTLLVYNKYVFAYDASCAFIAAHMAVEENIKEILNESDKDFIAMIVSESKRQTELCNEFVSNNITDVFSEIYRDIQTKKATYEILHRQKRQVDEFHKQGLIDEKEYSQMSGKILHDMHRLNRKSLYSEMPVLQELISKIELFEELEKEELQEIIDRSEQRIFSRGEHLFKAQEETEGVYILLRGKVSEFNEFFTYDHTIGSIIGIQNLLNHIDKNLTSSVAKSSAYTAYLRKEYFPNYENSPRIEEKLWQLASPTLIKLDPAPFISILSTMDYDRLKRLLTYCTYAKYTIGDRISIETGGILVSGSVNKMEGGLGNDTENALMKFKKLKSKKDLRSNTLKMSRISALYFIEPDLNNNYFALTESAIILHLCDELFQAWKDRKNSFSQAIDHIAYKRQNTLNIKSMDTFTQAAVNRNPRMMMKNEYCSLIPNKPSIFSQGLKNLELPELKPTGNGAESNSKDSIREEHSFESDSELKPVISSSEEDISSGEN